VAANRESFIRRASSTSTIVATPAGLGRALSNQFLGLTKRSVEPSSVSKKPPFFVSSNRSIISAASFRA